MKRQGYGKLSKTIFGRSVESSLKGIRYVFVSQFSNVSTNALSELRKNLRKNKAKFLVVKNTVGRKVVEAAEQKSIGPLIGGQCGLAMTNEDVAKISKVFSAFADENAGFKIKGAYVEGQIFTGEMVKRLASLPSREELLAKAFGSMQSPIVGFVSVLNQLVVGFVNVIEGIRRSKEKDNG